MKLVDSARFFPGTCTITRSGTGPFIDTERDTMLGERQYVSVQIVRDMASMIGCLQPEEAAQLKAELAAREAEIAQLREAQDELERLRNAVSRTLSAGAVVAEKKLGVVTKHKLRPKPGEKGVEVG